MGASVVSHKSDYIRHPGESRGPGTRRHPGESRGPGSKTGLLNPFLTLDTGFRRYDGLDSRYDGFSNVKKRWNHYTSARTRALRISWLVLAGALCLPPAAHARVGLSSRFVNVSVDGLEPGRSYDVGKLRGSPYSVKNRGDTPVTVLIEAAVPEKSSGAGAPEPIPDPRWIQVIPDHHRLEPGETGVSDIIVSLPEDPGLAGRRFHAQVWARTTGADTLAAGVAGNLRFSVVPAKAPAGGKAGTVCRVQPASLYVERADPGPLDTHSLALGTFRISNPSPDQTLELTAKAVPWRQFFRKLPSGFTTPEDVRWAAVVPERLVIPPRGSAQAWLHLNIPADLAGKDAAFLVLLETPEGLVVGTPAVYVDIPAESGKK